MPPRLGLKVDVDTLQGFREGVPGLVEIFAARGIKASFFVSLGPDNSGKAVFRVFKQQGFLEKMWRTRAPAIYGLRTMLYGTLLPAPVIGQGAGAILPALAGAGHEVGLHGYDHVRWHDHLLTMSREEVSRELAQAQEIFSFCLGHTARAFAAPGWQCSAAHRAVLAGGGFLYSSDTRGYAPYFPRFGAEINPLLEIEALEAAISDTPLRAERMPQRASSRRRRNNANEDKFYVDPTIIPPGMSYEWKRYTLAGQEDEDHMVNMQENGGWTFVPSNRKGHERLGQRKFRENAQQIVKGGCVLMERPIELTEEALAEDKAAARGQVNAQFTRLGLTPRGTMDRVQPKVKRSFEAYQEPTEE